MNLKLVHVRKRVHFCAMVAGWLLSACVAAQSYPTKPVRIIVPFAPGGSIDVVFRLLVPALSEGLGQQVLIDNRPGGAAIIGTDLVAKAPADGYTVGVANVAFGVNPYLTPKLPYNTEKDFAPVSLVATSTMILAVHPSVPVRSVREFIALAKKRPNALNYASGGNGSSGHLAAELFMYKTGVKLVHVPFKGGGPAVISAVSGETAHLFGSVPAAVHHLKAGRLIGLGVSSATRDPALPDVPTIAEAGVPGYDFVDWNGVVAPAGTPRAVINRLQQELVKVLAVPAIRAKMADVGARAVGTTPDELGVYIQKQLATWSAVVKATGLRMD